LIKRRIIRDPAVAITSNNSRLATANHRGNALLQSLKPENLIEMTGHTVRQGMTQGEGKQFLGDEPYQKNTSKTCPDRGRGN
jgi:hypothetical protein